MNRHDARLVPAALAAWAGAWVGPARPEVAWVAACVLALIALTMRRPGVAVAGAALIAVTVSVGAADAAAAPVRDAIGHRASLAVALLEDAPAGDLVPVDAAVRAVDTGDGPRSVRARVTLWLVDSAATRGERLIVSGELARAERADAAVFRPWVHRDDGLGGADRAVAAVRDGFRESTRSLPPSLAGLVRGMVIGDTTAMTAAQVSQMRAAGLAHLTAVSGAHFAIVLMAAVALTRALSRSRRMVALVAACTAGGFTLVVFPDPSVVRALTMAAAVILGTWWGRPSQALPALAGGVAVIAVVAPHLAREPGFAMSVLAVAGIALWSPALVDRIPRVVPRPLAHAAAVCMTAQAAVAPVLALIGGTVGPWAVAANLAVAWAAVPVTLLGVCALVLFPALPAAGIAAATAAGWCAWPVDAAARVAAGAPGASIVTPTGVAGAVVCAGIVAVAVVGTFAVRTRWGVVVLGALVVALAVASPAFRVTLVDGWRVPRDWLAVACDVGQGDAMLLRAGPHAAVVIDAGPDTGAAARCARRYGVTAVPLAILTHPHADHDGGLADMARVAHVDQAWLSPAHATRADATDATLRALGIPTRAVGAGDAARVGDVSVRVLAPTSAAVTHGDTGLNDASVVVLAHVGPATVLALGDIEHEGQRLLDRALGSVVVDVVKVAHHGSARQDPALAASITARLAVVSVGADNTYGHPAPEALALYTERAAVVARTDECGDIVIVWRDGPALASSCPAGVAG